MKKIAITIAFLLSASCLASSAHKLEPMRHVANVREILAGMGIDACAPDPSLVRCSEVSVCVAESPDLDAAIPAGDLVFYRCVDHSWKIPASDGSVDAGALVNCARTPPTGLCEGGSLCLGERNVLYECRRRDSSWALSERWTFKAGVPE